MITKFDGDAASLQAGTYLKSKILVWGGLVVVYLAVLTVGCQVHPRGHGPGHGGPPPHSAAPHGSGPHLITPPEAVNLIFDTVVRHSIGEYYRRHPITTPPGGGHRGINRGQSRGRSGGMPPGLAKKGSHLPPGLAKKGGHLPPGLQKRALPRNLEVQLAPPPPNTERVIVNNQVLLLQAGTHQVLDVINLAIHH